MSRDYEFVLKFCCKCVGSFNRIFFYPYPNPTQKKILFPEKPCFQDEVPLTVCSTRKLTAVRLDDCILCQKTKLKEYLSSGEIGRARIISLAKEMEVTMIEPTGF